MESSFAMTMLVFLGAAIIMVPLVRKLGFSSVIGYILGGIIIGPFALRLTGNQEDDIMHVTEFGVVMLLFLVGLEMEPKKFWSMRRKILGLGLSQVVLTASIIFGILHWSNWRTDEAMAVALCFSLSSTAIVLQILQEKNLFNSAAGQASFSNLLFQDIAFIPILASLPFIAQYHPKEKETAATLLIQELPEWMQSSSVILGVIILIFLGRYVFVPFLRYVSRSNMNELLTASALFLVLGVSELMAGVGLSPALGTFIAGVMLANSEFRHEMQAQIDPFKGLFLAVFFVSVGASINFQIIFQDPVFIFSMVAMVLVVKFAILFGIGKFFKLSSHQNFIYAFGLSQVGEFAFVLLNYSVGLYLISSELNDQMMAVVAITMIITPFIILINDYIIAPKLSSKKEENADLSLPKTHLQKKIIIVGFGHFGSTVGRLLRANSMSATILDQDADRVKLLRTFGFKVYYGDATRLPILRQAGADQAEILVLCLDSSEANTTVIELAKENFPHLKIFVRAKNRVDAYDFLKMDVDHIYRETLGTAVNMAVDLLHETGMRKYMARRMGKRFMLIDRASVRKLASEGSSNNFSFIMKESLKLEADLLNFDSLSFEEGLWTENDDEDKDVD